MPGPWDFIHDRKPKPLREHLLDEFAARLSADLKTWPLPVGELDPTLGAKWAHLLAPQSVRPSPMVFEQGFRLARWELERQLNALDEYMRNERWLEAGIPPPEKQALLFVSALVGRATTRSLREHAGSNRPPRTGRVSRSH